MTISDHRDLVAALLGVPGVAAATVEPLGGGPGTLRLQLASGADEVDVAGAVNRLLRNRFGLAVDTDRVRVLEATGPGTLAGPGLPPARVPDVLPPRPANGRPPLEADLAPAATPVAESAESAERTAPVTATTAPTARTPPRAPRAPRAPPSSRTGRPAPGW